MRNLARLLTLVSCTIVPAAATAQVKLRTKYNGTWTLRKDVSQVNISRSTPANWDDSLTGMKRTGFIPVYVFAHTERYALKKPSLRFDHVWWRSARRTRWKFRVQLTAQKFRDLDREYRSKGLKLVCRQEYVHSGRTLYAGIWHSDRDLQIKIWKRLSLNRTNSTLTKYQNNKSSQVIPIFVKATEFTDVKRLLGGIPRFDIVALKVAKPTTWKAYLGVRTGRTTSKLIRQMENSKLRLASLDTYHHRGKGSNSAIVFRHGSRSFLVYLSSDP